MNETEAQEDAEENHLAVWARRGALPTAPDGYGWLDRKGVRHPCASLEELSKTIREDRTCVVSLVWTPDSPFCRIPEEVEELVQPIQEIRERWAADDLANTRNRLKNFGIGLAVIIGYMAIPAWGTLGVWETAHGLNLGWLDYVGYVLKVLRDSALVGFAMLAFLIFAFIPWYQAQKKSRELGRCGSSLTPNTSLIRFDTWLDMQKAPVTWALLGIIALVFLAQVIDDRSILGFHQSIKDAGLDKNLYRGGDYWRLFTSPLLHGGLIHFVMNASALLYLGKRLEVLAGWAHVPIVFLFSAMVGGESSAMTSDALSVGASGGLMGWLGFLLIFETLHSALAPKSAKRRLLGGVMLTALIGLVGYRFIDNAAHFGGLGAGMAYAVIVFPKSSSVMRPKMNMIDRFVGMGSLVVITGAAVFAVIRMLG